METVIDALKVMGKATAREIAAKMKIDVSDAIQMLRDHEDRGEVELMNGHWSVSSKLLLKKESEELKTQEVDKEPIIVSPPHTMELIVPTPQYLNAEIRRLNKELRRAKALKSAVVAAIRQLSK